MASIILPLLAILVSLGGVIVVIGRRIPDIRRALLSSGTPAKGESADTGPRLRETVTDHADTGEPDLTPRTGTLTAPKTSAIRQRLLGAGAMVIPVLRSSATMITRLTMRSTRGFFRLFRRAPASERLPQLGTRNGKLDVAASLPERTVTREPRSLRGLNQEERKSAPARSSDHVEEKTSSGVERPMRTPSIAEEPVDSSVLSVRSSEKSEVGEEAVPEPESPVSIETTRDVRSRRRRRVGGRIRQRKTSTEEAPASPETPTAPAEPVEPASTPSPAVSEDSAGRPVGWVSTSQTIPALIEEGKLGRAESLLIDILSKDPRNTEAYKLLGTVYLKRGEVSQAQEVFEEALRRDPTNAAIPGLLGETYFSRGEYSKALPMYQKAHSADEQNIEYLEKLLAIFTRTDRRPMVRVTAKKILALNPQHPEAKKLLERVGAR